MFICYSFFIKVSNKNILSIALYSFKIKMSKNSFVFSNFVSIIKLFK